MKQLSSFTQNMMANFPSWMKMAKDPDAIGAQFLDAFGLTLEGFKQELDEAVENFYIETAHTDMIDLLYKIPLATVAVDDLEDIDYVHIFFSNDEEAQGVNAPSLRDFYRRGTQLPAYYIDRHSGYLYLRIDFDLVSDVNQPFKSVAINNAHHYDLELHHVWNVFDEFGLLLGLSRLEGERNEAFKARILDVCENPGNSTQTGIQNGIARELGIDKGTIEVVDFHNQAFGSDLVHPDGRPTARLVRYAKELNEQLKFTWDEMNLGDAYWFSIEQENLGIHYLPHIWDVDLSLFSREEFQSGVGNLAADDLKVTGPKRQESAREFKAYVSLIGYFEDVEEFFPEIAFQYKIYAKGKILDKEYEEEPFRYTVEAAEVFEQDWRLEATQDFPYTLRTEFHDPNAFIDTPGKAHMQFGQSNDFLHTQTDEVMRLGIEMATSRDTETNRLRDLEVIWEDTLGDEHNYLFQTSEDFLVPRHNKNGEPETAFAYSDVSYEELSGLGLGYGAFVKDINTTAEWQQGSWESESVLINKGTVTLNLDRMAQLIN